MAVIAPSIISGNLQAANDYLAVPKMKVGAVTAPYLAGEWRAADSNLPEGSVVVIELTGMLYVWETNWLISTLKKAEANAAVAGVVLIIDGPGGHATRVDVASEIIKNFSKPVATVVTGCMCSAHFWIGSSAGRIFLESKLCQLGSVGAMAEFSSFAEFYKMQGIDIRHIYPESSDLKNEETRAIEDANDESLTKTRLADIHRLFAETVADNLGIAYDSEQPIFRRRVFSADESIAAGYAHQFGSVEDAAKWVVAEDVKSQVNNLFQ